MTIKEVLIAAADLIEEVGWTQGKMTTPSGEKCAAGAISTVVGATRDLYWGARDALASSLGFRDGLDIVTWNDEDGRTQAEVVAALRSAAEAQA